MPTNKTEHEFRIKADARDVKGLGQEIRKAMSTATVKQFQQASRDLNSQIKELGRTQSKLNKELEGVDKGTEAYDKLKDTLQGVSEKTRDLRQQLRMMDQAFDEAERKRNRRQNFVAGLGQGSGLAQYIPTGPGMGARMAGAGIGAMARRGAGAAAAPFLTPGMGGLSTMLGSIPIAGGFAQGALQSASGYYQQAVGYDRAKLANLYFAGPQMGEMWNRGAPQAAVEELQAAQAAMNVAQSGQGPGGMKARGAEAALAAKIGPGGIRTEHKLRQIASLTGGRTGATMRGATRDVPTGITEEGKQLARARQAVVEATDKDKRAAQKRLDAAEKAAQGKAGRYSGLGPTALGAEFGFDPTQAQGMLGQFFGARGGEYTRGSGGSAREAAAAFAAQSRFGVGMQVSGQLMRGGTAGGGGTGMEGGLAGILGAAVKQGLKGSMVPEYLQGLLQLQQEAEQRGIKVDWTEFSRQTAALGGMGIAQRQRGRIAGGLTRAARGISERGASKSGDLLMMRAFGFEPGAGRDSYLQTMERMEGGFSGEGGTEAMINYMGLINQGLGGIERGTPEETQREKAFFFRRRMQEAGVQMSSRQSKDIMSRMDEESPQWLMAYAESQGMVGAGGADAAQAGLLSGAAGRARSGAGLAVTSAQQTAAGIGTGRKMAGTFQALERIGRQNVATLGNFQAQIKAVTKGMEDFSSFLGDATKGSMTDKFLSLLRGEKPNEGGGKKRKVVSP